VFRDAILGFVSSIQMSSYDMVRLGDWITMEKFGADGAVEEINLTTVKVRNFDKTITTIPTYAMISDSFINWRGMEESDGRRIKRAINIRLESVKFADQGIIEKLSKLDSLKEFIEERQKEIEAYNKEHGFVGDQALFGRRQTNLGLFRRYIEYYLDRNPHVNQEMTKIVRQLPSNEYGVPIELYCFSVTKDWGPYEVILADIFDHLFAIVGEFELSLFERPTGSDFRNLAES